MLDVNQICPQRGVIASFLMQMRFNIKRMKRNKRGKL